MEGCSVSDVNFNCPAGESGNTAEMKSRFMHQYLFFASLGLCCSFMIIRDLSPGANPASLKEYNLKSVRDILQGTDCSLMKQKAQIAPNIKDYMSTKLRYQFEVDIVNEMAIGRSGRCKAQKLFGLYRHGTRYPTAKHLNQWEKLKSGLHDKLVSPNVSSQVGKDYINRLLAWTNPLYQAVSSGIANASSLSVEGMREEYCLGQRIRQRFPDLFHSPYVSTEYDFHSTEKERAVESALSYAEGLFGNKSLKSVVLKIFTEEEDDLLRFYDVPCQSYDSKMNTRSSWYKSFLDSAVFQKVKDNLQQYFDSEFWKLAVEDVVMFYHICIHEMSFTGRSCWCDIFTPEMLSVMEYSADLKSYWVKGSGYKITGQRSVNLVKFLLNFFKSKNERVSLSFAHAETILPFLSFLDTFPVVGSLTPHNYEEQKSRKFKTSHIVPYAGNTQLVLYHCQSEDGNSDGVPYVRLLVNERPVKMGLCGQVQKWAKSLSLCPLEQLYKNAYNATNKFSDLNVLCKAK